MRKLYLKKFSLFFIHGDGLNCLSEKYIDIISLNDRGKIRLLSRQDCVHS